MKDRKQYWRVGTGIVKCGTDMTKGTPLIELFGQRRVLVENHQGIIGYNSNEILINAQCGSIRICGNDLKINIMCKEKLVVTGRVSCVNLCGRN